MLVSNLSLIRKTILLLVWLGFVAYTLWLTPLDQPDTWPLVQKLLTFQGKEVNAIITALFDDDMARRGLNDARIFWAVALIPLFGPLVYLYLRPSLPETSPQKKVETQHLMSLLK